MCQCLRHLFCLETKIVFYSSGKVPLVGEDSFLQDLMEGNIQEVEGTAQSLELDAAK